MTFFRSENQNYELRNKNHLMLSMPKAVRYGTERLRFLGPKIWQIVPNEFKEVDNLCAFKIKKKIGFQIVPVVCVNAILGKWALLISNKYKQGLAVILLIS